MVTNSMALTAYILYVHTIYIRHLYLKKKQTPKGDSECKKCVDFYSNIASYFPCLRSVVVSGRDVFVGFFLFHSSVASSCLSLLHF